MEYHEFKRMLVEMGCIGRVIDVQGKYVRGLFEYTMPDTLRLGDDDTLCIHPMFYSSARMLGDARRTKYSVYPYGADPEDEDFRPH
jgi:hypothetical protein